MKILFYINVINGGGAARVMVNLTKQFSDAGHQVVLVTSYPETDEYPVSDKVKRLFLVEQKGSESRLVRNFLWIRKLRTVCKQEKADIVVSFMLEPNFRSILATIGLPAKTIISVRNDPQQEYKGKLGKLIAKHLLPMADGCVFQTPQAKAWFPKKLQDKSAIICNAVAEAFFAVQRKPVASVITAGRLIDRKNHAMLIRAFARLTKQYPAYKLLIYGDGKNNIREKLEQLIADLQLQDKVVLFGEVTNVPEILSEAGIFVLPSDFEGMPNALMEALAAGVPSISTDCPCGGPKMLIAHEENGLLIPVGDEDALAEALDRLLSDSAYAEKLGAAARERAKSYAPEVIFQQWQEYVESVLHSEKESTT